MYTTRLSEHELRQEVIRVCRLLWERGYVAATDGNVSVRLSRDRVLATPSGFSKGFIKPEELIVVDMEGKKLSRGHGAGERLKPTSELLMHLEAYRQRPDVHGVVHAHPPTTVAFTIAGVSLAKCVLPEVVITLGSIPTAEYATPSTAEGPEVVRDLVRDYDAIVLDRHGTLTVGTTVWDAYLRLEKVEHTAEVTLVARQLGAVRTLSPEQLSKLTEMRRQWMIARGRDVCQGCTVCEMGDEVERQGRRW